MIKYWYIGGDIHGDWRPIQNWEHNELRTRYSESALILLGDVGANYFNDYRDRNFKKRLNTLDIRCIYCVRGNHEMRASDAAKFGNYKLVWDDNVQGLVYIEAGFPDIRYFADEGGIYHIDGHPALIVPGAYSVDKDYRLQMGWSWFPNEQLNEQEQKALLDQAAGVKHFDYILAHTCPLSWEPQINDLFMSDLDQSRIDKSTEKFLDQIISVVDYKHFYFGHFHDDRDITDKNATMLFKTIVPLGDALNPQVDE